MQYRDLTGFFVLRLSFDQQGRLDIAISEALLGGLFDKEGSLIVLQTVRGREIAGAPIVGRDGEVTFNGGIWPGAEAFLQWAAEHIQ